MEDAAPSDGSKCNVAVLTISPSRLQSKCRHYHCVIMAGHIIVSISKKEAQQCAISMAGGVRRAVKISAAGHSLRSKSRTVRNGVTVSELKRDALSKL